MNSNKYIFYWLSGLTIVIAILFRFYNNPIVPPSLNWDEASFGYNAYSIIKTGKDEFGNTMPLYFRSLDDNKLPVYEYLTVISVSLFGLNDFAVRFPSAVLGVGTVILTGILLYIVTNNSWIAWLSALLLAILPWHIQFSRMAAEANSGLFFLVAGVTAFCYGIRKHYTFIFVSLCMLLLSVYSYLSFRVVAPLLGFALVGIYFRKVFALPRRILMLFGVGVLLIGLLLFIDFRIYNGHIRFSGTNVFTASEAIDVFHLKEQEMFYDATKKINLVRRMFHDTAWLTAGLILTKGYLSHFSPSFLFFDYSSKHHQTPFVGLNYLIMLPFLLIGCYSFIRYQKKDASTLLVVWFFLAPVAASLTYDVPHAIRAYAMVIPIVVWTAAGIYACIQLMRYTIMKYVSILLISFLFGLSVLHYGHQYLIHLPRERSRDWVYGRKEMTEYLESHKNSYDRIVVSSSLEWPYIFMLYYSKYNPQLYILGGGTKSGGFAEEGNRYDRYEFHKFHKEDIGKSDRVLFVGLPKEFIEEVKPKKIIYYLDGTPAIIISEEGIVL